MFRRIPHILLLISTNLPLLYAGTTGKIAGRVTDKKTGEPMVGVNVVMKSTRLGAATDAEGYYFILHVPPGVYEMTARMMGFEAPTKQGVRVSADMTTTVNFALTDKVIAGDVVVVTAEKPLVQRDQTAKSATITAETFAEMPIVGFEKALTSSTGFTTDQDGEIHVRGGRSGEAVYMIDGVYVRDPYSGGFGSQIDKYSIEELQVITGAFNAEYGQAMSGVINIITKEGGSDYHGRFEYESDALNDSPYQREDWLLGTETIDGLNEEQKLEFRDALRDSLGHSLYQPTDIGQIRGNFSANFGGPVPLLKNLKFFTSGRYYNTTGYAPWGYDKQREFNTKLSYSPGGLKMNLLVQRNFRKWKPYDHRWKYNPAGFEDRKSDVARESLTLTHILNKSTFYEARFSRFHRKFKRFSPGKHAEFGRNEETGGIELLETNFVRPRSNSDGFFFEGDNGTIDDRDILTYTGQLDFTSQVNRNNLVKAGFQLIRHRITRETFIQPWEGENHRFENFTRRPIELGVYVQNKLEHDLFVINMGLRLDYTDARHTFWPDPDVPGHLDESGNWVPSPQVKVPVKKQLSPRIGIGFPVSDKMLFWTSYGHFYQNPSYLELYASQKVDEDRPLIGNPAIKPQRTVAFEAGVKRQISDDYALDFSFYFKDITNLAGSTFHGFFPFEYTLFDNSNYASVNGVDVTLTKRMSHLFSATVSYSFQVAKGNESDPREGFNDFKRSNFPLRPKKQFFLDFDRRHDFSLSMNIILPKTFGPDLLGSKPFGDLQLNILFEAGSGLPYTPRIEGAGEGGLRVEKNSAHRPPVYQLDLKILKMYRVQGMSLTGFLVIKNLFDRVNALRVWNRTGLPWDDGLFTSRSKDRIFDPSHVDIPRQVSAGFRFDF
ncbi:MAG: TonB-dependent receptor domain-containing protein [bacterium]